MRRKINPDILVTEWVIKPKNEFPRRKFAIWVRKILRYNYLTTYSMEKAGFNGQTLCRWKNDRQFKHPKRAVLLKFCRIVHLTSLRDTNVDDLMIDYSKSVMKK